MRPLAIQLLELGVSDKEAKKISTYVEHNLKNLSPEKAWQLITQHIFTTHIPFSVHQLLYKTIYPNWDKLPQPVWFFDESGIKSTNIYALMHEKGFHNYDELHQWSVRSGSDFWEMMVKRLHIIFGKPYSSLLDLTEGLEQPHWFPDGKLNIANSCFQAPPTDIAIISQTEQGEVKKITYQELNLLSNQIANSVSSHLKKGDRVAIIMPMTHEAVAIYLAVIKAGCAVVSIADSFSAEEIATRLRISDAKMVFAQDHILRDGKSLPFYKKIIQAKAPMTVVLPAEEHVNIPLRSQDIAWYEFISDKTSYSAVACDPSDTMTVLFSSGTTGEPKAIPWTHTTPIKCASDAYLHHDLHPEDIFCWPTNLGWMVGPWLVFASLINHATIALYDGTPNTQKFGKFIQDMQITHLGVVPTLVKTWRNSQCMEGLNWSNIKLFTSTGECSNVDDMLYLMHLVNYQPIIEYCGGTEIGGAYITGTLVQPCAPAAFTTPALGIDFVILDDEVALIPPSIGLSTTLLNKDHHDLYYANMPNDSENRLLRRHGDHVKRYPNGFYRLHGRVDDTMKIGGIKISSAEIESVLNTHPAVYETAAIGVDPPQGGPSQLIIFSVIKKDQEIKVNLLMSEMQEYIKIHLNPLFKIHKVIIVDSLPRTASNKVMRRLLRDKYDN